MKTFLKIINLIFISLITYFVINLIFLDTEVNAFNNFFIPSNDNYSNIESNSFEIYDDNSSKKVFNEFNESIIDPNSFYIRIDKIDLFKRVIKDVDPRYKEVYVKSWEYGVSHGKFTSYPDKVGITYLFSHAVSNKSNAINENAWFTYLDQLIIGDEIIIYYEGKKYTYEVSEIKAVSPDSTGFYTGASSVSKVRLQYCGPPTGSLNSRTLVDAIQTSISNI